MVGDHVLQTLLYNQNQITPYPPDHIIMVLIPHILNIVFVLNYGIAFGALNGKTAFIILIGVLLCLAMAMVFFTAHNGFYIAAGAAAMLGSFGNLLDRATFNNAVVDYLNFFDSNVACNIADLMIFLAILLFFLGLIYGSVIVAIKYKKLKDQKDLNLDSKDILNEQLKQDHANIVSKNNLSENPAAPTSTADQTKIEILASKSQAKKTASENTDPWFYHQDDDAPKK